MSRKRKNSFKQLAIFEQNENYGSDILPDFASTPEEIKTAVERNAINRGLLLIKIIDSLNIDDLLNSIREISISYDKETVVERLAELNINIDAIRILEAANPPIPYPYYFCTPEWVIDNPKLFFYYRNIAMLSTKVMNGLGYNTQSYEAEGAVPSLDDAKEIVSYLNGITGSLIRQSGVSTNRHLEMVFSNLGDSLGGTSRNEVGRLASAEVIGYILKYLHPKNRITKIVYKLKGNIGEDDDSDVGKEISIDITKDTDIDNLILFLSDNRVKYRELYFSNGFSLLLDRQIKWYSNNGEEYKICSAVEILDTIIR